MASPGRARSRVPVRTDPPAALAPRVAAAGVGLRLPAVPALLWAWANAGFRPAVGPGCLRARESRRLRRTAAVVLRAARAVAVALRAAWAVAVALRAEPSVAVALRAERVDAVLRLPGFLARCFRTGSIGLHSRETAGKRPGHGYSIATGGRLSTGASLNPIRTVSGGVTIRRRVRPGHVHV